MQENRIGRITAILEEQMGHCRTALNNCTAGIARRGSYESWEMRMMLSMMQTCAQFASVIGRLEARGSPEKNPENGSSIPQ